MTSRILQLPREVLQQCFEYSDYSSICYSIPTTCRMFKVICGRESLWLARAKSAVMRKEIHVKSRLRQGMPYGNLPHPVKEYSMKSCIQFALLKCITIQPATCGLLSNGTSDSKAAQLRERAQNLHLRSRPHPISFSCRQHLFSLQIHSQRILLRTMAMMFICTCVNTVLYLLLKVLDSDPIDTSDPLPWGVVIESWIVGALLCVVLSKMLPNGVASTEEDTKERLVCSVELQKFGFLGRLSHPIVPLMGSSDTVVVYVLYSVAWHAWAWGLFHSAIGFSIMFVPVVKFIVVAIAGNLLCFLLSFTLGCGLVRQMDPIGFQRGIVTCEWLLAVLILSVFCAPAALLVARLMRHSSIPWMWQQLSDVLLTHMEHPLYWVHCVSSIIGGLVFAYRPRPERRNICEHPSPPSIGWCSLRIFLLSFTSSVSPSAALPIFIFLNALDILLVVYQWRLGRKFAVVWRCKNCPYWDYHPPKEACCDKLLGGSPNGEELTVWKDIRPH